MPSSGGGGGADGGMRPKEFTDTHTNREVYACVVRSLLFGLVRLRVGQRNMLFDRMFYWHRYTFH